MAPAPAIYINPSEVFVDWRNYCRVESGRTDFHALMKSIDNAGQQQAAIVQTLKPSITVPGRSSPLVYELVSGFRRFAAIQAVNDNRFVEGRPPIYLLAIVQESEDSADIARAKQWAITSDPGPPRPDFEMCLQILRMRKQGIGADQLANLLGVDENFIFRACNIATKLCSATVTQLYLGLVNRSGWTA